jgi:DNA polymerase-1
MREAKRIYVIDSTLMMYRYFRGLPAMVDRGKRTEAVYGYTKLLMALMAKQPDGVIAVFDEGEHNFRNYVLSTYKEHYVAMPPELKSQVELAKEVCEVLNVPIYSVKEVEADDVIGSIARKAARWGKEVVVVSTDRDFFQLLGLGLDETKILVPSAESHGLGETPILYDEAGARAWVEEKYGVAFRPKWVGDLKAISGSPSKDIPGVKGIGDRGAAQLVAKYGPVENIVKALGSMPAGKGSWREKLEADLTNLLKSKELTTIRTNVPLKQFRPEEIEGLKNYTVSPKAAETFLAELGFKDLALKSRKLSRQIQAAQVVGLSPAPAAKSKVARADRTELLFI